MIKQKTNAIIIPQGVHPWPHELRVAYILVNAGHKVQFIPTTTQKRPDILLDNVIFEIKSPKSNKTNSLEHLIKKALHQSPNIIFDMSRMPKSASTHNICTFLVSTMKKYQQIKHILLITKDEKIIDINTFL